MRLLSVRSLAVPVALVLLGGTVHAGEASQTKTLGIKASHGGTTIQLDTWMQHDGARVAVLERLLIYDARGISHHVLRAVAPSVVSAHAVALLAAWAILREVPWTDFDNRLAEAGLSEFELDVLRSSGPLRSCQSKASREACESTLTAFTSLVDGASRLGRHGRDRSLQIAWRAGLAAFGISIDPTPVMPPVCDDTQHLDEQGSVAKGVWKHYQVSVCAGQTVVVRTEGTGDMDLYLRLDQPPTLGSYDLRGYSSSSDEMLVYTAPKSGTLHIGIVGYGDSSTFVLKTSAY